MDVSNPWMYPWFSLGNSECRTVVLAEIGMDLKMALP